MAQFPKKVSQRHPAFGFFVAKLGLAWLAAIILAFGALVLSGKENRFAPVDVRESFLLPPCRSGFDAQCCETSVRMRDFRLRGPVPHAFNKRQRAQADLKKPGYEMSSMDSMSKCGQVQAEPDHRLSAPSGVKGSSFGTGTRSPAPEDLWEL